MKPLITTFAIVALGLLGSTAKTEAHEHHGRPYAGCDDDRGYRPYVAPSHLERYLVGYDRWGNPVFAYRRVYDPYRVPVCAPRRYDYVPPCPPRFTYTWGYGGRRPVYRGYPYGR